MKKKLIFKDTLGWVFDNLQEVRQVLLNSEEDYIVFDLKRMSEEEFDKFNEEDVVVQIDAQCFKENFKGLIFRTLYMYKKNSLIENGWV